MWSLERMFPSNKFVSAINASTNYSSPNKCRKWSRDWVSRDWVFLTIFTNTVCLSWRINRRKLYWCRRQIFGAHLNLQLYESTTVLTIILSAHLSWIICRKKNYIIFAWVIKITSDSWRSLISRLITFRKAFAATVLKNLLLLLYSAVITFLR